MQLRGIHGNGDQPMAIIANRAVFGVLNLTENQGGTNDQRDGNRKLNDN